jgi:anti-sigma regulatory factor (Ser/Thr protein kinase)
MGSPRARQLQDELSGCADVDAVARVVLAALLRLPDATRAGIALLAPGGRQLHFLPSDPDRWAGQPEWCLIDAYDDLPLNDCIRTGRAVHHGSPASLAKAYPELARAQQGTRARSVCAVPVVLDGDRLGGMLVYLDVDLGRARETELLRLATELAEVVAEGLAAVRPAPQWPEPLAIHPGARECLLPSDARAPTLARRWLAGALAEVHATTETSEAALVCISELVTNVVMHAGRPSVVSLVRDGDDITVLLRHLSDPSPRRIVRAATSDPLPISGHGLRLVEALSSAWGSEEREGVTTAWCRLPA